MSVVTKVIDKLKQKFLNELSLLYQFQKILP